MMKRIEQEDILARNFSRSAKRRGEDKWYRIIKAPNANAKGEHIIYCDCMPCLKSLKGGRGTADCGHLRDFINKRKADEILVTEKAVYVCASPVDYENFHRAVPNFSLKPVELEDTPVQRNIGGQV